MKLNSLKPLKSFDALPSIKPLDEIKISTDTSLLSETELILYSTNLLLFSTRILRDEIQIKNRKETLSMVNNEVVKIYNLLSKKDFLLHSSYTKKDTKDFFKKVGLKPRHIRH